MMDGKVAVVTGAGRGIGRAHAHALSATGVAVVVNDLGGSVEGSGADPGPAESVAAEIRAAGGRAVSDSSDVSDWVAAGRLIETALAAFGRLDIVVNNAGINRFGTIDTISGEDWQRVLAVNLTGTAAVSHWAAAHWRRIGAAPGRAIVNTSSPAGTNPVPGAPAYCAAKAGVAALTIASAAELAELGVRVNAIAPMARSRMTAEVAMLNDIMAPVPAGRFDRVAPENVSRVMLYLADPACRFTGRVFGVEGDDVFVFSGFSAAARIGNDGMPWAADALAAALDAIDRQDRGYFIAPSQHLPGPSPADAVFDALAAVERGERVHIANPVTG